MRTIYLSAFRIWFKAILINAGLIMIAISITNGALPGLLAFVLSIIAGCISTLPLVYPVGQLIRLSLQIPYSAMSQNAWLTMMLLLLATSFYYIFLKMFGIKILEDAEIMNLIACTWTSIILSVALSTRTLSRLKSDAEC